MLGEIDIVDDLVINGSTSSTGNVTLRSALGSGRIFNVDDTDGFANTAVSMNNLTLTGGNVVGATSNEGGGIRNYENLSLRTVTLSGNQADVGGGFANYGIASLRQVRVAENVATRGGGIANLADGLLTVQQTTIEQNHSFTHGGGLDDSGDGQLNILQSTIAFNTADADGGGLSLNGSNARLQNATIYGNQAGGSGGGVNLAATTPATGLIQYSTIVENSAAVGGGGLRAAALSVTTLEQSVVANNDNHGLIASPDIRAESEVSATYSLIGDQAGSAFQEARPDANGNLVGGPQGGPLDPLLQPLADNGGPTRTVLPMPVSLVIDAGSPTFLGPPQFDQRGMPFTRISGYLADMGAVERQQRNPDVNSDGNVDCVDVDSLVAAVASGSQDPLFDFNEDGQVNHGDVIRWLELAAAANIGPGNVYLVGDANLDGFVDGSDFNLWNTNKFKTIAAWCRGDFNADGSIDGSDFNLWNTNKFRSGFTVQPILAGMDLTPSVVGHQQREPLIWVETTDRDPCPDAAPVVLSPAVHDQFWSSFGQRASRSTGESEESLSSTPWRITKEITAA